MKVLVVVLAVLGIIGLAVGLMWWEVRQEQSVQRRIRKSLEQQNANPRRGN